MSTRESPVNGSSQDSPELPPHERTSITNVPVTPGIQSSTYLSRAGIDSTGTSSPSYFTRDPAKNGTSASSGPASQPVPNESSPSNLVKDAPTDLEVLRRMSVSTKGRRQSISEIKAAAPELALSGNILSVTFTTPHALKYHKNGEWVSLTQSESF